MKTLHRILTPIKEKSFSFLSKKAFYSGLIALFSMISVVSWMLFVERNQSFWLLFGTFSACVSGIGATLSKQLKAIFLSFFLVTLASLCLYFSFFSFAWTLLSFALISFFCFYLSAFGNQFRLAGAMCIFASILSLKDSLEWQDFLDKELNLFIATLVTACFFSIFSFRNKSCNSKELFLLWSNKLKRVLKEGKVFQTLAHKELLTSSKELLKNTSAQNVHLTYQVQRVQYCLQQIEELPYGKNEQALQNFFQGSIPPFFQGLHRALVKKDPLLCQELYRELYQFAQKRFSDTSLSSTPPEILTEITSTLFSLRKISLACVDIIEELKK